MWCCPFRVPGITTGITMVFVPSVSTFIISRMLGGGSNMMVGDLIETQFLGNAYNPNLGSAISLVLMVFILLVMSLMNQFEDNDDRGGDAHMKWYAKLYTRLVIHLPVSAHHRAHCVQLQ